MEGFVAFLIVLAIIGLTLFAAHKLLQPSQNADSSDYTDSVRYAPTAPSIEIKSNACEEICANDTDLLEQIEELKSENARLHTEIFLKNKEISSLTDRMASLNSSMPHRELFTVFFEAVKRNYGDLAAEPEWYADAYVLLFKFYLNHHQRIEKILAEYVPTDFRQSNIDVASLFFKILDNKYEFADINFEASAVIKEGDMLYATSLTKCNCVDHVFSHRPCKHMIALSKKLDISWIFGQYIRSEINRAIQYEALTEIVSEGHERASVNTKLSLSLDGPMPQPRKQTPKLSPEMLAFLRQINDMS